MGIGDEATGGNSPQVANKSNNTGKIVGGIVAGVLGVATGGVGALIVAVLPFVISAVAGMFKDHSPEFYLDSGLDKMNQYFLGKGGDKGWLADQLHKARLGVKGLIAAHKEDYAGGVCIYYLPYLAFPIDWTNAKGELEHWDGDKDLQKIACALYAEGYLQAKNMFFDKRPPYKITDGIATIRASSDYAYMVANNIDGAADKEELDKVNDTINTTTAKAKTLLQKYWYVLLIIPAAFLYRLIFGRK